MFRALLGFPKGVIMDLPETWEVIHDAFLLNAENELEIYRKWIPVFDGKLKEYLELEDSTGGRNE